MQRVLVVGGAGYIGSHTCKALGQKSFQPIVFDDFSMGQRWAVKWGPLVEGNLADRQLVLWTLEKYRVSAVIHFAANAANAANAAVAESMQNPFKSLHHNVIISLRLFEAMREAGVRHLAFSSTGAAYGVPPLVPISEDALRAPVNPYGESKLFVERAAEWLTVCLGWRCGILTPPERTRKAILANAMSGRHIFGDPSGVRSAHGRGNLWDRLPHAPTVPRFGTTFTSPTRHRSHRGSHPRARIPFGGRRVLRPEYGNHSLPFGP